MLPIPSKIIGKRVYYGDVNRPFSKEGFGLAGGWEYDFAYFDAILHEQDAVTIYIRLPSTVLEGKLDREDAYLEFGQPFLIKHVVHTGLSHDKFDVNFFGGLNQFQKPLDPDDRIEHERHWVEAGGQALERILRYV